jgi:dipeptidyl aminopeptidase/acylaminoacyl peptidase
VSGLTVGDVLDVRHAGRPQWSPDGRRVGFLWNQNGPVPLYVWDGEGLLRVSEGEPPVREFCWDGEDALYVQEGRVHRAAPGARPVLAVDVGAPVGSLRVGPGGVLAFTAGGTVWILGRGSLRRLDLPADASLPGSPWGPDGHLMVQYRDGERRFVAVADRDGHLIWRTEAGWRWRGGAIGWAGGRVLALRGSDGRRRRRLVAADPFTGVEETLLYEEAPAGLASPPGPVLSPDGTAVAVYLAPNGWDNLHVLELATGSLRRLTAGEWEDFGHSSDPPEWSPDAQRLVFASSRGSLAERQLYVASRDGASVRQITDMRGTSCDAVWSPDGTRIAFLHCGPDTACDLWLWDGQLARRLTESLPAAFTRQRMVVPEEVRYPSAHDGAPVPAFLWRPKSEGRHPALVWVHGGPMRQMRFGWQPLHSYMLFYAFHQYLAERGYAALWVNYRGGIGYGRAFERGARAVPRGQGVVDCGDVVGGAAFLRQQPFVDPERVGVWGLSWGGYLTLCALTRHPGTFAVGVNLAGMWDMDLERPREAAAFSPKELGHRLRDPLYNLQGTADRNVSFRQMDAIVRDGVRHHLPFWTEYYPGEVHVFEHRDVWEDAFAKIEAALARHLRPSL